MEVSCGGILILCFSTFCDEIGETLLFWCLQLWIKPGDKFCANEGAFTIVDCFSSFCC